VVEPRGGGIARKSAPRAVNVLGEPSEIGEGRIKNSLYHDK